MEPCSNWRTVDMKEPVICGIFLAEAEPTGYSCRLIKLPAGWLLSGAACAWKHDGPVTLITNACR